MSAKRSQTQEKNEGRPLAAGRLIFINCSAGQCDVYTHIYTHTCICIYWMYIYIYIFLSVQHLDFHQHFKQDKIKFISIISNSNPGSGFKL